MNSTRRQRHWLGGLVTAALMLFARQPVRAQEMEVPVPVHVSILMKVIAFDRQLKTRAPRHIVVGIVYQSGNRASVAARDEAIRTMQSTKLDIEGMGLRTIAIDLDDRRLADEVRTGDYTHLYITPLRGVDVRMIATIAREAQITTMTGVPRYVVEGVALGVAIKGGRPKVLVNLEACRLEGADMSAELLKLADIIQ